MFKLCSWCQSLIGLDDNLEGESYGICKKCLRKFFPKEYSSIFGKLNQSQLDRNA